jgi:hypothetical protein
MSARDVLINILTKGDPSGAKTVTGSLDQLGNTADRVGKRMALGVTAPLLGFAAVAVKTYATQQKAEVELAAAIKATGGEAESLLPKYKAMASAIQAQTIIGDEQTLALAATATQMGINSEQMDDTIKGAIGLSKAFGLDLTMATRASAAALQGNTSLLTRYIPQLATVTDESEKLSIAMEGMERGFKQAQAEAESVEGQIQQAKNAMGDLAEVIGERLSSHVAGLALSLKTVAEGAQNVNPMFLDVGVGAAAMAAALGPGLIVTGSLIKNFQRLKSVAPAAAAAIGSSGAIAAAGLVGFSAGTILDEWLGLSDAVAATFEALDGHNEGLADVLHRQRSELAEQVSQISSIVELDSVRNHLINQRRALLIQYNTARAEGDGQAANQLMAQVSAYERMLPTLSAVLQRNQQRTQQEAEILSTQEGQHALRLKELGLTEEQWQVRKKFVKQYNLEIELLDAQAAGDEAKIQRLEDELFLIRERVKLERAGITGSEADMMAKGRLDVEKQAAEAAEKRLKAEQGINAVKLAGLGIKDPASAEDPRSLNVGVRRDDSFRNTAGEQETRFFKGGRQIDENEAYGGTPAPAAPAAPSIAPQQAPALNAQPLNVAPLQSAITAMFATLQKQLDDLASQIAQQGN